MGDRGRFPSLSPDPAYATNGKRSLNTVPSPGVLGLSIVHKIVEAHDGTIEVASTPGEGTVFKLRFPFVA